MAPASFATTSPQAPAALTTDGGGEFAGWGSHRPTSIAPLDCLRRRIADDLAAARFEHPQIALVKEVDIDIGGIGIEKCRLRKAFPQERKALAGFGGGNRLKALAAGEEMFGRRFLAGRERGTSCRAAQARARRQSSGGVS